MLPTVEGLSCDRKALEASLRSLFASQAAVKGPKDQREKWDLQVQLAKRAKQDRRGQPVIKVKKVSQGRPVLLDRQLRPRFALSVSNVARVHVPQHVTRMKCSSPPTAALAEVL
jgi:hypothetical protein